MKSKWEIIERESRFNNITVNGLDVNTVDVSKLKEDMKNFLRIN